MMEKELEKRRRWPWKNLKNNGVSGGSEGGSSPNPAKLFGEQDVARILQDQIRIGDEQIVEALHAAELKYSEEKKVLNEKLADVKEKLVSALADITIKDNFIKLHIEVAEEAIVGWEKAEQETAECKIELEKATQQRLATEDRASYLELTLKDRTQQLHVEREELKKHLHEITLEKGHQFENLRAEMEIKLEEVTKSLSHNQNLLIESQAENEELYHALKDSSRMIAELNDMKAHTETCNKILQVRLEAYEKENLDLKLRIQTITKELEIKSAELEYGRNNSDMLYRHEADSVITNVKLEDESSQIHMIVYDNPPSVPSIIQTINETGPSSKEPEDSSGPRRRPLHRSHREGLDILPWHALVQEGIQDSKEDINAVVERIAHVDGDSRILTEASAKRNKELQASHHMCTETASRLIVVEDELDSLRAEMTQFIDTSSPACSMSSMLLSKSKTPLSKSKNRSRTLGPMNALGNECLAPYELQSKPTSDNLHENAHSNYPHVSNYQRQVLGLRNPKRANDRKLDSTNVMCEEPCAKITAAASRSLSKTRNTENAESSKKFQKGLDSFLSSLKEAQEHLTPSTKEQATKEILMQEQLNRAPVWERDVELLSRESAMAIHHISDMKPQLREAYVIVDALREELKAAEVRISELRLQEEKQKHEDELIEEKYKIFYPHLCLAKTIRAADVEMNELHVKLAELEADLHDERRRHHNVAELQGVRHILRNVQRDADRGGLRWEGYTESSMEENYVRKGAGQEREMAARASAECQRTILALCKHLKILGFSKSSKLTPNARYYPDFGIRMTESLEQWLTRYDDTGSSKNSASIESSSPTPVPASPGQLGMMGPSTLDLPVIVRRSVRTFRPLELDASVSNGNVQSNPIES